jgi:phosphoglucosamine mutase
VNMVEAVEKALGNRGRGLVSYSGTEHMCRVMVEGPSQEEKENNVDKSMRRSKKSWIEDVG